MKSIMLAVFAIGSLAFGQTRIDNGMKPEGPIQRLVFQEDLRIGADCEDDDCLWTGANVSVSVNERGEMFVTDPGGNRVIVYDAQGEYLKTIGRAGQGPGEFAQLYSYQILNDQSAVAFDNNQSVIAFSYFDQNHKYVDKVTMQPGKRFIQAAYFSPSGKQIAAMYVEPNADPSKPGLVYSGLIDQKTEPLLSISEAPQVLFDQNRMTESNWWSEFLADWFKVVHKGVGTVGFGPKGEVYTAKTTRYEITLYNQNLKAQKTIARKYRPKGLPEDQLLAFVEPVHEEITGILPPNLRDVVTPAVVKKALTLAEFPPRKQPIFGLLAVEDKGLLVIHDHNPLTGETKADFFSPEGVYRGETELPPIYVNIFAGFFGSSTRIIFKNGFAYTILVAKSGDRHLVRYKYRIETVSG